MLPVPNEADNFPEAQPAASSAFSAQREISNRKPKTARLSSRETGDTAGLLVDMASLSDARQMRTQHLLHSNTTAPIKGGRSNCVSGKESMGIERTETPSRRGSHVGTVIKSVSQALGLWKSDYDLNDIVTYKEGKFVANKETILEVLNNGSNTDKTNVLKQLKEEIINIIPEERYAIWEIVRSTIDLTKQGTVRRESFRLLDEILKLGKAVTCNELAIYQVISENVNLKGNDQDMDLLLRCLHHLFQNSDMKCYEKYSESPIDEFLMKAFNCIIKSDSQETVALIISLISQCLEQKSDLFPQSEFTQIFLWPWPRPQSGRGQFAGGHGHPGYGVATRI